MNRWWVQALVFLLASTMEVRVRADIVSLGEAKSPIELPENCLVEASVCTIKTDAQQKYTMEMASADAVLAADSVLARLASDTVSVVSGYVFIRAKSHFQV